MDVASRGRSKQDPCNHRNSTPKTKNQKSIKEKAMAMDWAVLVRHTPVPHQTHSAWWKSYATAKNEADITKESNLQRSQTISLKFGKYWEIWCLYAFSTFASGTHIKQSGRTRSFYVKTQSFFSAISFRYSAQTCSKTPVTGTDRSKGFSKATNWGGHWKVFQTISNLENEGSTQGWLRQGWWY